MSDEEIKKEADRLQTAFSVFEQEHPDIAEAMKVMNISFPQYIEAITSLKEPSPTSGTSTSLP
jgi:hypothetical protein